MSKMSITLQRKCKINCGNYSSAEANVMLNLDDIAPEEFDKKYELLSQLMSNVLMIESAKVGDQELLINRISAEKYVTAMKAKNDEVEADISKLVAKLAG